MVELTGTELADVAVGFAASVVVWLDELEPQPTSAKAATIASPTVQRAAFAGTTG